ncbi:MAG: hemerythrin domain-containing protein [Magnetospirillum sp.]|jgi:hemerythrin-like domain-containing protein|nr:hemerythrin domain-containing protein [Magnetospirillum sp.]
MLRNDTAPTPLALLDDPLAYVLAAHFRQRAICAVLRRFATARVVGRVEADRMIAYLVGDLRLHHEDEDIDLYPVLRRRALPADGLGIILARLGEEHRQGTAIADQIVAALAAKPADEEIQIGAALDATIQAYAACELKHLALENGVVLALARIRLTRADLTMIGRSMKLRRGVVVA